MKFMTAIDYLVHDLNHFKSSKQGYIDRNKPELYQELIDHYQSEIEKLEKQ